MDGRINWDYSYLSLKVEVEVEAELGKSLKSQYFFGHQVSNPYPLYSVSQPNDACSKQ